MRGWFAGRRSHASAETNQGMAESDRSTRHHSHARVGWSTHLAPAASAPLRVSGLHQAIYIHVDFGRLPKQPGHNQR